MWKLVVGLAFAAMGCIQPGLVLCANGLACPSSDRCDEIHHTCVLPEQLTVCTGSPEGTDCMAGPVSGACFDDVCLPRGCGNRVAELGEMCDDGNQISEDGCSSDCKSTEVCGNGFVDPGEPCDDGGLISHDGCDSRCELEDAAWSSPQAISPDLLAARLTAYDPVRERLVNIGTGTWEWDGEKWTMFEVFPSADAVFWDPDRQQVGMIGLDIDGATRLYAWNGAQWLLADTEAGPAFEGFAQPRLVATYDTVRHRVIVIETDFDDTSEMWTVDALGRWEQLPTLPDVTTESFVAFDPASGHVVLETTGGTEWMFDGTDWSSSPSGLGTEVSLAIDPGRGHLIAVDSFNHTMHERIGTTWTEIEDAATPCHHDGLNGIPPLYLDGDGALQLFGTRGSEICRWDGAWTRSVPALPFNPVGATYDPATRGFVVLHNAKPDDPESTTEAWTRTADGWHRLEASETPSGWVTAHAVYSPGRAATVLYEEKASTSGGGPSPTPCSEEEERIADSWAFDGAGWIRLGSVSINAPACTTSAAAYDPEHRRVTLATYNELWALGDDDEAWQRLATTPSAGQVYSVAWHARNASLMAIRAPNDFSSPLSELRGDDWAALEIIPGTLYSTSSVLVGNERSGGVIVLERNNGQAWERLGDDWIRLPSMPQTSLFALWTAYNPVDGSVLVVGRTGLAIFTMVLSRSSATPFESCTAGEDLDGDGHAGCDDPDCYWACSGCLPHTSCP